MPTDIQYALLAANSYAVKEIVTSKENAIPIPVGFVQIDEMPNDKLKGSASK